MNKEGPNILFIFIIITAFGIKELHVLCQHFGGVLQHAEIDRGTGMGVAQIPSL